MNSIINYYKTGLIVMILGVAALVFGFNKKPGDLSIKDAKVAGFNTESQKYYQMVGLDVGKAKP